jgi:lipopolysaccharide export system permease protein
MLALFAFIVYYNLMTLGQSWVAPANGHADLHGPAARRHLALAALVLAVRHNHWSPHALAAGCQGMRTIRKLITARSSVPCPS